KELVADDREYSDSDALQRVRLEKKIDEYKFIQERFNSNIESLIELADLFYQLKIKESKLAQSFEEDKAKLRNFEEVYKNFYLAKFNYSSNPLYNISIQEDEPFKYFPVFKSHKNDAQPQSIRTNSSASD